MLWPGLVVPELGFVVVVDVVELPPEHDTKTTPASTSTASAPIAAIRCRRRRRRRALRVWRSMALVCTSLSAGPWRALPWRLAGRCGWIGD